MTVLASDDFNRADENPLAGDWATGTGNGALRIVSNAVTSAIDGTNDAAIYNAIAWPANQYSQAVLNVSSINGVRRGPGLVVRYAAAANTCYRFTADHAASNNIDISRLVTGTRTTVVAFTQAWTDGDTWRFDVTGPSNAASLRLFLNGTMIREANDTSSIASGTPGIFFGDNVDITSWSADTWSGGTVNTESVAWLTA